jgi:hypothetical protein
MCHVGLLRRTPLPHLVKDKGSGFAAKSQVLWQCQRVKVGCKGLHSVEKSQVLELCCNEPLSSSIHNKYKSDCICVQFIEMHGTCNDSDGELKLLVDTSNYMGWHVYVTGMQLVCLYWVCMKMHTCYM